MIKVSVTDDQLLFRKGIISLINSFKNFEVCLETNNGKDLVSEYKKNTELPDIAIIDLSMPVMNGLETLIAIKALHPKLKCVILTVHEEDKYIYRLVEAGANAYIAKNTEPAEFEKALIAVHNFDFYFNATTIAAMSRATRSSNIPPGNIENDELTKREKEILILICKEFTAKEIAEKLFISERTAEGHRNNLLLKTGCKNTAGLVIYAIKNHIADVIF